MTKEAKIELYAELAIRKGVNLQPGQILVIGQDTFPVPIEFTFQEGRIVDYSADSGQDALKGIIETDDGAHYLGEIALVPVNSPICQYNMVFLNPLYDENASCHFAIGRAYPACIAGGNR